MTGIAPTLFRAHSLFMQIMDVLYRILLVTSLTTVIRPETVPILTYNPGFEEVSMSYKVNHEYILAHPPYF
jgi:hypothetical protein